MKQKCHRILLQISWQNNYFKDEADKLKRYNLALIPLTKNPEIIQLAQIFAPIANQYLLGKNSFPHVTLYHFDYEEKDIKKLWQRVNDHWKESPIFLQFDYLNDGQYGNWYWISLMPNQREILHQMHGFIAALLMLPLKKSFDPHMTLINTSHQQYDQELVIAQKQYSLIADTFVLALGKSDPIGQLTHILYQRNKS
jgi:hypothetical protein